jgi:hypothetical protein
LIGDPPRRRARFRALGGPLESARATLRRSAEVRGVGLLVNALQEWARIDAMKRAETRHDAMRLFPVRERAQAPLLERHNGVDGRTETERKLAWRHAEREAHVADQRAEAFIEA